MRDANGRLCELIVNCVKTTEADKPKGYIQWVSSHGIQCEVRLYDRLWVEQFRGFGVLCAINKIPDFRRCRFNCEYPDQAPDGFLSVLNKNSIKIVKNAMVDESTKNIKVFDKVQFERIGYFSVDTDSTSQHVSQPLTSPCVLLIYFFFSSFKIDNQACIQSHGVVERRRRKGLKVVSNEAGSSKTGLKNDILTAFCSNSWSTFFHLLLLWTK